MIQCVLNVGMSADINIFTVCVIEVSLNMFCKQDSILYKKFN
jgi:hypothetical protein